jgi:hypothetical protein
MKFTLELIDGIELGIVPVNCGGSDDGIASWRSAAVSRERAFRRLELVEDHFRCRSRERTSSLEKSVIRRWDAITATSPPPLPSTRVAQNRSTPNAHATNQRIPHVTGIGMLGSRRPTLRPRHDCR